MFEKNLCQVWKINTTTDIHVKSNNFHFQLVAPWKLFQFASNLHMNYILVSIFKTKYQCVWKISVSSSKNQSNDCHFTSSQTSESRFSAIASWKMLQSPSNSHRSCIIQDCVWLYSLDCSNEVPNVQYHQEMTEICQYFLQSSSAPIASAAMFFQNQLSFSLANQIAVLSQNSTDQSDRSIVSKFSENNNLTQIFCFSDRILGQYCDLIG